MEKKVCIITGANSGIGKQAAIQIAKEDYHVIIACRSKKRGTQALKDIIEKSGDGSAELMLVDMSCKTSIRLFAQEVIRKFPRIDVLIHNAAIFDTTQKEAQYTQEGLETVWVTNHVGPVLLTDLLLDTMKKSKDARILVVSSKGLIAKPYLKVDFQDPEFKNKKYNIANAYYQAKRAQEMYICWLAERLKGTSVTANCIRVTAVQVDLNRHPNLSPFTRFVYSIKSRYSLTPEEMAHVYTYFATSSEVHGITGKYFEAKNKEVRPNLYTTNKANIEAVLSLTLRYI